MRLGRVTFLFGQGAVSFFPCPRKKLKFSPASGPFLCRILKGSFQWRPKNDSADSHLFVSFGLGRTNEQEEWCAVVFVVCCVFHNQSLTEPYSKRSVCGESKKWLRRDAPFLIILFWLLTNDLEQRCVAFFVARGKKTEITFFSRKQSLARPFSRKCGSAE